MRLSKETILEILLAYADGHLDGEPPSIRPIALRFKVDPSTVRHHIQAFEHTYGSAEAVYTMIRSVQRICHHPSLKCLVCGQAHDNIHRRELEEIERLKSELEAIRPAPQSEEIEVVQ